MCVIITWLGKKLLKSANMTSGDWWLTGIPISVICMGKMTAIVTINIVRKKIFALNCLNSSVFLSTLFFNGIPNSPHIYYKFGGIPAVRAVSYGKEDKYNKAYSWKTETRYDVLKRYIWKVKLCYFKKFIDQIFKAFCLIQWNRKIFLSQFIRYLSFITQQIQIGDTIPEEKLERIFEQFYRLDASRSTSNGGAGLGLAIAKQIVELHHGTIQARSFFAIYVEEAKKEISVLIFFLT